MILVRRLLHHAVVRNALLLYVVQFSGYVLPFITLPYLSRVLSTDNFGLISYAQFFIWYFVTLTEYGFNLTATRAVAIAREDTDQVDRIFSAVMIAKCMLTVLGLFMLVAIVLAIPKLRPHLDLFLISFLAVIGNFLFPLWLYQGLQKMEHVALRDFAAKVLSLVALLAFVHRDSDYLLAAASQSGGLLLAGFVGLLTVRKLGVRFRWTPWSDVRDQFKSGWPAFISLAVSAFAGVTNTFILGLRASPAEIAYYSGAQRIIAALRSLVSPISTAVYPHASQKAVQSEHDVIAFVRKYQLLFTAPFIAAGLVLLIGSPWLVRLVLSAKYAPSIPVLQIMAFVPALLSLTQVYSTYYMLACGYDKEWMRIILITVAINFIVLIPSLAFLRGSIALGWTALITEGSGTLLYWRFYLRRSSELDKMQAAVASAPPVCIIPPPPSNV